MERTKSFSRSLKLPNGVVAVVKDRFLILLFSRRVLANDAVTNSDRTVIVLILLCVLTIFPLFMVVLPRCHLLVAWTFHFWNGCMGNVK